MAKFNIYGHVLYSEIEYEKLMYQTKKIFIQSLMNKFPSITEWTEDIWNNIDHEYMIQTMNEIKQDIIDTDYALLLKYSNTTIDLEKIFEVTEQLQNMYDINPVEKFRAEEINYGKRVAKAYKRKLQNYDSSMDLTEFLTRQIKDFHKIENCIPYNTIPPRYVSVGTYLSMLYNVNLTRTGWNQTFKDAEYFEKDLLILETHSNSCPLCAPMQRKSIFKKW